MRLCIVSSGDFFSDYGGGQVYVRNLVDEMAKRADIETSVISIARNAELGERKYNGVSVKYVHDEVMLKSAIQKLRPDIVHAHGAKLSTARACKSLDIPCVVTAHHGGLVCPAGTLLDADDRICQRRADFGHCLRCYLRNTPTGPFWYPLLRRLAPDRLVRIGQRLREMPFIPFVSPIGETDLIVSEKMAEWEELSRSATFFIAPSTAMAEAMKRNGCVGAKIAVIPHGIPTESRGDSLNAGEKRDTHIAADDGAIHFYCVGRINRVKGLHVLLEAFQEVDDPRIRLHIIGGAVTKGERRYLRRLMNGSRRDHRIIWHGKLSHDEMAKVIEPFHCLIHPAIYLEVFGLDIAEAIAAHKYVIATRCGGAEMQIHNDGEGMLVAPNDAVALAQAIQQYCMNTEPTNASTISMYAHVDKLAELYDVISGQTQPT